MIENLDLKLSGELPVNREELIVLVDSWGRNGSYPELFYSCKKKECYELSNLDISKIDDLSFVFSESNYNGDLSKWNVFSCKNMERMFDCSIFNNDSIKYWDISNVKKTYYMFYNSKFEKDISLWNFSEDSNCDNIFVYNENFKNKYNSGKEIPDDTNEFLEWFEKNRENIKNINQGSKEEVLDFFSFDNENMEIKD